MILRIIFNEYLSSLKFHKAVGLALRIIKADGVYFSIRLPVCNHNRINMGLGMAIYVIVSVVRGHTVAGWASMMMSIWLLGGLQLMALGLIGEYIGKIYMETKRRPKFILEEHLM